MNKNKSKNEQTEKGNIRKGKPEKDKSENETLKHDNYEKEAN